MRLDDGRVVSNFLIQALKGEPITLYGDGTQTRSFCYIDDLVDGLISMMNTPNQITGPINLGNPVEFSMTELVNRILQLTNSKSPVINLELPADDPKQRKPDIAKAETILDWHPKVLLEQGLLATMEDMQQRLANL
jgi:UDP-glucuronate decarboxylase